jgi:flagellar hook-associated protein 1 FlgK
MSSLTSAVGIAVTGLKTTSSLVSVASNNVSNANTPGYSRKTSSVKSVNYNTEGGGSQISATTRATDPSVTKNYNAAISNSSYYSTMNSYLSQTQSILDSSSTNPTLSNDISNFSSAWSNYSAEPESAIQQQNVINTGKTLAGDIGTTSAKINALDTQVLADTQTTITSLNNQLKQMANLNNVITASTTSGQETTDFQDQQDSLVNSIASYLNITVQSRSNGQIALYTSTGQLLVDGGAANQFTYNGTTITDQSGNTVNGTVTGGILKAQLDFRDSTQANSTTAGVGAIAKLKSQISTLVAAFVNPSNNQTGANNSAFATAYSSAVTASTASTGTQNGDALASSFFSLSYFSDGTPDPGTLSVTASLQTGASALPQTNTKAIADSFTSTANYSTSGLSASNITYSQLASQILSGFQQSANSVSSNNVTYASQESYYKTALSNSVGVNLDTELANLQIYQNSYSACAHVITTVNSMINTLLQSI